MSECCVSAWRLDRDETVEIRRLGCCEDFVNEWLLLKHRHNSRIAKVAIFFTFPVCYSSLFVWCIPLVYISFSLTVFCCVSSTFSQGLELASGRMKHTLPNHNEQSFLQKKIIILLYTFSIQIAILDKSIWNISAKNDHCYSLILSRNVHYCNSVAVWVSLNSNYLRCILNTYLSSITAVVTPAKFSGEHNSCRVHDIRPINIELSKARPSLRHRTEHLRTHMFRYRLLGLCALPSYWPNYILRPENFVPVGLTIA